MHGRDVRAFYDGLAADYHLIFADYRLELFILLEGPDGWELRRHLSRYHAIRRGELGAVLASAGFDDVRWLAPDEAGLHQPTVIARAP